MRILFCNIAWMKYYQGAFDGDIPQHGGSYVEKNHEAGEDMNFSRILNESDNVEYCYGNYATKSTNGKDPNEMHIEKIEGCNAVKNEEYVDDVLIVWCARSYTNESVVVGWYKHAIVYRNYQSIELQFEDGQQFEHVFNIMAKSEDCVLLPEGTRNKHIWAAARRKKSRSYGFGQANVWYANEETAKCYVDKMVENIEDYDGENWVFDSPIDEG